jgi:hypothetical protein
VGNVNLTCKSNPSVKCKARQTCIGGGPIAGIGLGWNLLGAVYGINDSNGLGGWSGSTGTWGVGVGVWSIGFQFPLFGAGGSFSGGPSIGAGGAYINCYTDRLQCTCSNCDNKQR